jgi:hypothetical protein
MTETYKNGCLNSQRYAFLFKLEPQKGHYLKSNVFFEAQKKEGASYVTPSIVDKAGYFLMKW